MFDEIYNQFKNDFFNPEEDYRKISINNVEYFIFVDIKTHCLLNRSECDLFWHLASVGREEIGISEDEDKFVNILPCFNTRFENFCDNKCDSVNNSFLKELKRYPCIFRASCINYVKKLLIDYKNNDPIIKVWEYGGKIYFRKLYDDYDFVAIFEERNGTNRSLRLKTAFPIQLKSYKRRYDRQYKNNIIK